MLTVFEWQMIKHALIDVRWRKIKPFHFSYNLALLVINMNHYHVFITNYMQLLLGKTVTQIPSFYQGNSTTFPYYNLFAGPVYFQGPFCCSSNNHLKHNLYIFSKSKNRKSAINNNDNLKYYLFQDAI